ncbi:hypothetical protein V6N11_072869 [Hibiscus sabdariffa]|uniref:Uncharacterized protein n=2 Tax=Hibiscus sabdariffa TaxID=183260 RepID=A0ABR1ZLR7_9ROSI
MESSRNMKGDMEDNGKSKNLSPLMESTQKNFEKGDILVKHIGGYQFLIEFKVKEMFKKMEDLEQEEFIDDLVQVEVCDKVFNVRVSEFGPPPKYDQIKKTPHPMVNLKISKLSSEVASSEECESTCIKERKSCYPHIDGNPISFNEEGMRAAIRAVFDKDNRIEVSSGALDPNIKNIMETQIKDLMMSPNLIFLDKEEGKASIRGDNKASLPRVVGLRIGISVCVDKARRVALVSETNFKGVSKGYDTILGT